MPWIGIIFGLGAGTGHSVNYLTSRWYQARRGGSASRQLLVIAHVIMGGIALGVLPFVWPERLPEFRRIIGPTVGIATFYLFGQLGVTYAVARTEASRVAPLLGFKVVVLALLSTAALAAPTRMQHWPPVQAIAADLSVLQWLGVVLCLVAAFMLNRSGGSNPPRVLVAVSLACLSFCGSDVSIRVMMGRLAETVPSTVHASTIAVCLSFILCGIYCAALLPWLGSRRRVDWVDALPFALTWLAAMVCLYTAFAMVGVVFGAILQSTRGIISVGLGVLISRIGHVHLEQRIGRGVFVRRAAAAVLMTAAIALYASSGNRSVHERAPAKPAGPAAAQPSDSSETPGA